MAEIFAITAHQFWRTYQPLAPTAAVKRIAGKDFFRARSIIDALIEQKVKAARRAADSNQRGATSPAASAADALFDGAPKRILDKWREVKIEQERIHLANLRRDSIPRAELESGLSLLAGILRRAIEQLQRQYGNGAAELITEALGEAETGWEKILGPTASNDQSEGGDAADNARDDDDRRAAVGASDEDLRTPGLAGVAGPEKPIDADPHPASADDATVRRG